LLIGQRHCPMIIGWVREDRRTGPELGECHGCLSSMLGLPFGQMFEHQQLLAHHEHVCPR
jgi:hypothetical protein